MASKSQVQHNPAITGEVDLKNALHILPERFQPWRPAILSYTASLSSTIAGYPLDSIKTRMQTHPFKGILDCFTKTIQKEGLRGLFRGLMAPLMSSSVAKAIGVTVYTDVKPYAARLQHYTFKPLTVPATASSQMKAVILAANNAPVSFLAGASSGAACALFACPFEFTKLFQQLYVLMQDELHLSPRRMPKTTWQVAKQIKRQEGVMGLYSGFRLHLIRDAAGTALYFSVYETAKILIDGVTGKDCVIPGTSIPTGPLSIAVAGALSGVLSWVLVFPLDTVKSLTQRDIVSNIIRGLALKPRQPILLRKWSIPSRKMYRGLSVSITRSVITSVVFFSSFEWLMKHIA